MGDRTKIEWCDHTFNPWIGCQRVSPGCDHCYAEGIAHRLGVGWGPHSERRLAAEYIWRSPARWARQATKRKRGILRPKVFCASMADVFDNRVPYEWRVRLWQVIYETPELDWLILTKRPENIREMLPDAYFISNTSWPWRNVWLGISAEDQKHFEHRWPILEEIPAVVRFVSYEPALGPLYLGAYRPDWLICGGESGRGWRPMDPMWEAMIREQCRIEGIPYFFKQLNNKQPIPPDFPLVRQFPNPRMAKPEPPTAQIEMFT